MSAKINIDLGLDKDTVTLEFNPLKKVVFFTPCDADTEFTKELKTVGSLDEYLSKVSIQNFKDFRILLPEAFNKELTDLLIDYSQKLTLGEFIKNPLVDRLHLYVMVPTFDFEARPMVAIVGDGVNINSDVIYDPLRESTITPIRQIKETSVSVSKEVKALMTSHDRTILKGGDTDHPQYVLYKAPKFTKDDADAFVARRNKTIKHLALLEIINKTRGQEASEMFKLRMKVGFPHLRVGYAYHEKPNKNLDFTFFLE